VSPRDLQELSTARMTGEPVAPRHAEVLHCMLRDPLVARTHFPHRDPPDEREIAEHIAEKAAHWNRYGFGVWMLFDCETGEIVGRGGMQHTMSTGRDEIELLWTMFPDRWGEGLATELALAALDIAFDELELDEVIAYTLVDNHASRRVMEKAGLSYDRALTHVGLPHVVYRVSRHR
jgi:RimJ/RimL family protein N-acetyltransferase